jgi:glycerate-2-kinase
MNPEDELRTNPNRIDPWAVLKVDGTHYTIIAAGPINKQPATIKNSIAIIEDYAKRPGQYQVVTLSWEFGQCRVQQIHGFNHYSLTRATKEFTEKLGEYSENFFDSLSRKDGD